MAYAENYRKLFGPYQDEISEQSLRNFKECVAKEATLKGGLPGAVIGGLSAVYFSKQTNMTGLFTKVMAFTCSLVGYVYGKTLFVPTCMEKYVPEVAQIREREKLAFMREREQRYSTHGPIFSERPSTDGYPSSIADPKNESDFNFGNIDNNIDSNMNQPMFGEPYINELTLEDDTNEPVQQKPRLTYEELRRQNRANVAPLSGYNNQYDYRSYNNRIGNQKRQERTEPVQEDNVLYDDDFPRRME